MYRNWSRISDKYRNPSSTTTRPRQYFCEACAVWVSANDKAWKKHVSTVGHSEQLDSLQRFGRLGHLPAEIDDGTLEDDVTLSKAQAKDDWYGDTGMHNAAIDFDRMHIYWANVAMRLSCAAESYSKHMSIYFEPGEIVCLAELIQQKHEINSLSVRDETGRASHAELWFGDALAMRMLLEGLCKQNQLQSISVELLRNEYDPDPDSDIDSDDEPECYEEHPCEEEEKRVRLFKPVWTSVYKLLECGMRNNLRNANFVLPYKSGPGNLGNHADTARASALKAFNSKHYKQISTILMSTHSRLKRLPQPILKKIIRLVCPQPTLQIGKNNHKEYQYPAYQPSAFNI